MKLEDIAQQLSVAFRAVEYLLNTQAYDRKVELPYSSHPLPVIPAPSQEFIRELSDVRLIYKNLPELAALLHVEHLKHELAKAEQHLSELQKPK